MAIEYRLSDRKAITPIEAVEDAMDAIRWVRAHAKTLGIDPRRVIAYGQSASGQLAAIAAEIGDAAAPAIIISGVEDVVTPDAEARRFCAAINKVRGRCDVHSYPGVGHLLTRKLDPQAQFGGQFDFDPTTTADAKNRVWAFLRKHRFIDREEKQPTPSALS